MLIFWEAATENIPVKHQEPGGSVWLIVKKSC